MTRPRKPQLRKEKGITRVSLENNRRLTKRLGRPVRVECHYDPDGVDWYTVKAFYDTGHTHEFTGFAWGYTGEGPHGLLEFCQYNGIDLEIGDIAKFDSRTEGIAWVWPEDSSMPSRKVG